MCELAATAIYSLRGGGVGIRLIAITGGKGSNGCL